MPHSVKSISIIDMMETRTVYLENNFGTILQNLRTTSLGQNLKVLKVFLKLFLTVVLLMSTFKNKNSLILSYTGFFGLASHGGGGGGEMEPTTPL